MEIIQKERAQNLIYKVVLFLISLFIIYNVIDIFIISHYKKKRLWSSISSTVNTVKNNIKRAGPKELNGIESKPYLISNNEGSPWAKRIERTSLFVGSMKGIDTEKESEGLDLEVEPVETVQYEQVTAPNNTEIIFKGLADDLVLLSVRRKIDGQWLEKGFPTKIGERIGGEKVMGGKTIDFTTNYVLQDIIKKAQRPMTIMKKDVMLDENGNFIGTRMVQGETFMRSASKIMYEDDDGNTKELWLGEKEIIDEAKVSFEKNVETIKSILQEAEIDPE